MTQPRDSRRVPHLGRFQLDGWSVHQDEGTLCSEGRLVRLEPRVMDVLVYLAAEPGEVVAKEDLLEAVWGGAYVEEGALAQAIHSLRKALGDDARQPRYIQTIPKRGYRLVASVLPEVMTSEASAKDGGNLLAEVPAQGARELLTAATPGTRWRIWLLVGAALLGALTIVWLAGERSGRPKPQPVEEAPFAVVPRGRRIVVLPFEDLNNPVDPSFAKGLMEEITNKLASLADLQVISRTSAMHYSGTRKPLPEIARELRVDYVLEGTVRWDTSSESPSRVRITAQLIQAANDAHIWSEQFDAEVGDIFAVQSEISRRVSAQLGIVLTPEERRALSAPPTDNLEAYHAYQRGLELRNQPFYSPKHVFDAVSMFERATALAPRFATAWAEQSRAHCHLAFNTDRSPARVNAAKRALDQAVALDPGLQAVWLARIDFAYRCQENYDTALAQVTEAARLFPNDAEVLQTHGFILRRKGQLTEAARALLQAFSLNPKAVMLVFETAETYRALRNYEEADRFYQQAISMAPDEPYYWEERALNQLAWTGNVSAAREILAMAPIPVDPELLVVTFRLDLYAREYRKALSRISPERVRALSDLERTRLSILEALARERIGDHQGALALAESNRAVLEDLARRFPKEPFYPAYLAIALSQLGRSTEATALAQKVSDANRHDAFNGPNVVEFQAMTEATLGRRREAVELLSRLLGTSYRWSLSVHDLRLNPLWDSLRGDPGFEDLVRRFSD